MTIKGSLQVSIAIITDFLTQNVLSPVKICPEITVFKENGDRTVKFCLRGPQ